MNREGWLTTLAQQCEYLFKGFEIKPYRITCGWPSRMPLGRTRRAIGECHSHKTSKGGYHEIFISPLLDKPVEVGGTVVHEMCHVVAGIDAKHGHGFVKVAKHVGLTKGKPTSAGPGQLLEDRLVKLVDALGEYPHSGIKPILKEVKPSGSISLECPECGCRCSMSFKWLEEAGLPICGCGAGFQLREPKE
jgi:hypothetical protein